MYSSSMYILPSHVTAPIATIHNAIKLFSVLFLSHNTGFNNMSSIFNYISVLLLLLL